MRTGVGTTRLGRPALALALGAALLAPQAARAQFFWDQPRLSPDDVARSVMGRGFRPIHRPFRNDQVYVADVVDRRGRQERLIVSADTGEIVQRFYIEGTRSVRRDADPTIPPGPIPPGRVPNEDNRPNLFSRLFGGDDDARSDRDQPSQFGPNYALPPPVQPRPRPRRTPRVVERAPETVAPSAPIESAPLAPVAPALASPAVPAVTAAPAQPATAAPSDKPARAVAKDPLAIPGSKDDDDKGAKPAAFAVARPAPKPVATPPVAPAVTKPAETKGVPVAPLD